MKRALILLAVFTICGYLLAQPAIQVSPEDISVDCGYGLPSQTAATISNTGNEDLNFTISSPYIHPNLIAYFPFEGNAINYVPNGQSATVYGASLTTDRFGRANSAYYFDGQDDAINFGQYEIGLDWSVSFFMQSFQYSEWNRVFNAHHFNGGYWPSEPDISITQYTSWEGNYIVHNDYNTYYFSNLNIPDLETVLLTLTVSADGIWKMYVNGTLFGTHPEASDPGTYLRDVFLGTNANITSYFNGVIDDFMLFDAELNADEVSQMWNYLSLSPAFRSLLEFSTYEGTIAPGASIELLITPPSAIFPIGNHDLAWKIQSNDPLRPELNLVVSMNILAPNQTIDAEPVTLSFNSGFLSDEFSFEISNLGPGFLDYSLSVVDSTFNTISSILDEIPGFTLIGSLDNHRYYRSTFVSTWEEAKTQCEQLGGHLITLSSAAEDMFALGGEINWIGLSDVDVDGDWRWVTGETVTYTNWDSGEPNGGTGENYAMSYDNNRWNDIGSTSYQFVLEFDNIGNHPSITLSPDTARIVPGDSNTIFVTVDGSPLTTGTYRYFIKVVSNASAEPVYIPLTINANHILPLEVDNFSVNEAFTDANQIALSWSLNHLDDRVSDYKLYRRGKNESSWRLLSTLEANVNQYVDRNFTPMDTTWVYYKISAVNDLGEGPQTLSLLAALKRFLAPTDLSLQILNNRHVRLTWNPVVETISGTTDTPSCYVIYKSEHASPLSDFDFLGIATEPYFNHQYAALFQPANRLFYIVTAYGGDIDRMNSLLHSRAGWKLGELGTYLNQDVKAMLKR